MPTGYKHTTIDPQHWQLLTMSQSYIVATKTGISLFQLPQQRFSHLIILQLERDTGQFEMLRKAFEFYHFL